MKGKIMIRITIIFLLLNLMSIGNISSQNLDLTERGYGSRLRSQPIVPNEGRVNNGKLLNLRTNRYSALNSSISGDGRVIVLDDQLIKDEDTYFRNIEIPVKNTQAFRGTLLSRVDDILIIKESATDLNPNRTLHFLDINAENIVYGYNSPSLSFAGLMINSDASSFIFLNNEGIIEVNRINDKFESTVVNSGYVRQDIKYYSSSGDRIFFFGREQALDDSKWYIIDRLETGWSEPIEWKVTDAEGNELGFDIVDIANNGRTLLLTNANDGLALTHEIDGRWTPPEPIGYKSHGNRSLISENGKVIAVQAVKRVIPDFNAFYDVFIFLQNPDGQWIQRQVNDPQLEVHDGIMLSDDGTQLFWLPANTSSVPNAEEYK